MSVSKVRIFLTTARCFPVENADWCGQLTECPASHHGQPGFSQTHAGGLAAVGGDTQGWAKGQQTLHPGQAEEAHSHPVWPQSESPEVRVKDSVLGPCPDPQIPALKCVGGGAAATSTPTNMPAL